MNKKWNKSFLVKWNFSLFLQMTEFFTENATTSASLQRFIMSCTIWAVLCACYKHGINKLNLCDQSMINKIQKCEILLSLAVAQYK